MGEIRQRGLPLKPTALELIERALSENESLGQSRNKKIENLAANAGLSIDCIKRVLRRKNNPQKDTIERLANALNLKPWDIAEVWPDTSICSEVQDTTGKYKALSHDVVTKMLAEQIKRMTSNPLTVGGDINLEREKMYVPLGLMERRKKPRVKDGEAEKGSKSYDFHEEITRIFENDEFLCEVIEGGNSPKSAGKRIAIIGEPGAGKTTLLQQIVDRVSETHSEDKIIWVSLADLQGENLENYLLNKWLKIALKTFEVKPESKQALVDIFNTERVWLLLDGLDEMGINNPLFWMRDQIGQGWLAEARMVLTCRLNVWDNGKNYLDNFDVYRNLDFDEEQVNDFIARFFINDHERSLLLQVDLNKPGKERIRDLIKNPLQLTLLCYAWQRREGALPETKAGLYEWFVDTFYEWKSEYFPTTSSQREELNHALGELAKAAIDQPSNRFRLSRKQVVKHLGEIDQPLGKLALDIGWLNIVGVGEENPEEEVYAFFHASFQEYFAALIIDDYKFFLNHIPENPEQGIYRVFENEWKEVIVFWLGRKENEICIDNFAKKIVDFDDSCNQLYRKSILYKLSDVIRKEFRVCYLNKITLYDDEGSTDIFFDVWLKHEESISISGFNKNTYLILENKKFYDLIYNLGVWMHRDYCPVRFDLQQLDKKISWIKKGEELTNFFLENQLKYYFTGELYEKNFDFIQENFLNNSEQLNYVFETNNIDVLTEYLSSESTLFLRGAAIKRISSLIIENPQKLSLILSKLNQDCDKQTYIAILWIVRQLSIDIANCIDRNIIDLLQKIIERNIDNYLSVLALNILERITRSAHELSLSTKNKLIQISKPYHLYAREAESLLKACRYQIAKVILVKLAENMTYPEFYQAWYGQTENSIPEELRSQNLNYILEKIKTNNPNVRTIDIKILNQETNLDRLAKAIGNRIFAKLIPPINDIYDLEYYLKTETPNLALIFYGDNPRESFIQLCQLISDFTSVAIITDEPIEQPIQGFLPNQINLENALQTWLEKMLK
jgi:hypothetical protein